MLMLDGVSKEEMAKALKDELMRRQLAGQLSRGPAIDSEPSPEPMVVEPIPEESTAPKLPLLQQYQAMQNQNAANPTKDQRYADTIIANAKQDNLRANKTAEDTYKSNSQSITVKPEFLSPDDIKRAMKSIQDIPAYKKQQEVVDELEKFYPKLIELTANREVAPDLSPAIALTDSLFGSNLSQAYTRPQQPDLQKMLVDYFKTRSTTQNDLLERTKDLLSSMKGSTTTQRLAEELALKNSTGSGVGGTGGPQFNPNVLQPNEQIVRSVLDKFNTDSAPMDKSIKAADQVLLQTKNTGPGSKLALKVVQTQLARMREETGAMSTYDVMGTATSQAWADQLEQLIQRASDGTFTASNLLAVRDLARQLKNAAVKRKQDLAVERSRQAETAFPRIIRPGQVLPALQDPSLKAEPLGQPVGFRYTDKKTGDVYEKIKDSSDLDKTAWKIVPKQ
jgi:hypothetical protein